MTLQSVWPTTAGKHHMVQKRVAQCKTIIILCATTPIKTILNYREKRILVFILAVNSGRDNVGLIWPPQAIILFLCNDVKITYNLKWSIKYGG